VSKEAAQDPIHYSDWSALLGFMTEQEALNYVHGGIPNPITTDQEWLIEIGKARKCVSGLPARPESSPQADEITSQFLDHINKIQGEPTFQEHLIGMKAHRFVEVELDKLRCYQTNLNLEYIDSLVNNGPAPDDKGSIIRFCLPLLAERKKVEVLSSSNLATNSAAMISENLDLRVMGIIQGEDQATGRKFTGFLYGFGLSQISVVEYKGAYIIKNGYHRAFALYKKGHKKIPCLLLSTDNYESTGAQRPGFFPIDSIMGERPPLLTDFDSEAAVRIPRRRTRAVVNMHAEVQMIPL
jgi:hypothetical protein